ncbi:MBL fold metallo-hydrolase [Candidatus Poribacteria bacterium]|nr:MBL fold metallo-hydrolase [Candidatus Poribacteria bacterium]
MSYSQLSPHLFVHHDHVNTGIIRDGTHVLLIDPSGSSLQETLDKLGITQIDQIFYTHHHRDNTTGFNLPDNVHIGVPAAEEQWFSNVESFWNDSKYRWHLYSCHPHNLMLPRSIPVSDTYSEGAEFNWGPAVISVLDTPGHTDGSVTYLVDIDEELMAFTGDLIYDEGKIWDIYSLQKGQQTTDYHGFLGARDELKDSLDKVKQKSPKVLIPTHGEIIDNPDAAISKLFNQIDICYDRYVSISALRHYFPDMFTEFRDRDDHMQIRDGKPPPEFLRHIGTTWIIISDTKEAFVMDCGSHNIVTQIQQMQDDGEISNVTQFWVTHYHDDHVNGIPEFQKTYPCETITDSVVADVIVNPKAYRLPCISPAETRVDRITQDGDSWQWNEFKMTAYHFPGQTYYHGGLLVEGKNVRMFFSGDSFTMAGIDDYCAGNRNLLGDGVGYDRCLKLIKKLEPTHIFNCHVNPAFDFTNSEINFMLNTLSEREKCFTNLIPWDHANYGMDDQWIRCYPYEQEIVCGKEFSIQVQVTNHSAEPRPLIAQPIVPNDWGVDIPQKEIKIEPKSDGYIDFTIPIPKIVSNKNESTRIVIPFDITYNNRPLGQFREAIFVVNGG